MAMPEFDELVRATEAHFKEHAGEVKEYVPDMLRTLDKTSLCQIVRMAYVTWKGYQSVEHEQYDKDVIEELKSFIGQLAEELWDSIDAVTSRYRPNRIKKLLFELYYLDTNARFQKEGFEKTDLPHISTVASTPRYYMQALLQDLVLARLCKSRGLEIARACF